MSEAPAPSDRPGGCNRRDVEPRRPRVGRPAGPNGVAPARAAGRPLGRDIDGIVGGRLIRQFVVDVDYKRRLLTFHDPALFRYDGPGQVLPLDFDASGHPAVTAAFTPLGGPPVERPFIQVARPRSYASRPVHRASRT